MKKILAYIFLVLCVTGICGCSRGIVEQIDTSGYESEDINKDNYSLDVLDIELNGERVYENSYFYSQGNMYYVTYNETEYDISSQTNCVYRYNLETSVCEPLFEINNKTTGEVLIWSVERLLVNSSGDVEVYCIVEARQEDGMIQSEVKRYVYSTSGACMEECDIELGQVSVISAKCYADDEGNTYVTLLDSDNWELICQRYDRSGKLTGQVSYSAYINISCLDSSGRLVVCVNEVDKQVYGCVDFDAKKLDKDLYAGITTDEIAEIVGSYDAGLYLKGTDSIYAYDYESGEYLSLVNLNLNNLEGCNIDYFSKTGEEEYICAVTNEGSVQSEIFTLKKSDSVKEQDSIIIAAINNNDRELLSFINEYNRDMNDIRIEFRNYGIQSEEPYKTILRDIMTGNAPDIFITDNMNMDTLISKNMLEDLSGYIEGDETLSREYFADGMLEALRIDGHQYILTNNICIDTLAGRENDVKAYSENWNIETLTECYKTKVNTNLIDDASPIEVFVRLFEADVAEYVDFEKASCTFDCEKFRNLAEFCKELSGSDNEESLLSSVMICQPSDLQYIDIIYNNKSSYIGYPSANGGKSYVKNKGAAFAIYSASEHKEKAWEVIKELMTGDYGRYIYGCENGIPVSKEEFEDMVYDSTITEKYQNDDGVVIEPQNIIMGSENVTIGPASDEDIAKLAEMITNSSFKVSYDDIVQIVSDEVNGYFNDEKSIDNVVNVIQDKVTKYANENVK